MEKYRHPKYEDHIVLGQTIDIFQTINYLIYFTILVIINVLKKISRINYMQLIL